MEWLLPGLDELRQPGRCTGTGMLSRRPAAPREGDVRH